MQRCPHQPGYTCLQKTPLRTAAKACGLPYKEHQKNGALLTDYGAWNGNGGRTAPSGR
jgi:hypothetical protein